MSHECQYYVDIPTSAIGSMQTDSFRAQHCHYSSCLDYNYVICSVCSKKLYISVKIFGDVSVDFKFYSSYIMFILCS